MIKQKIIFTDKECEEIISFYSLYTRNLHSNNSKDDQKEILYNANVLPKNPSTNFVFKKLYDFFEDTSGFKLYKFPSEVYIMKYEIGEKFKIHNDFEYDRVFSVGIQLNDDYLGGDYVVYKKNGDQEIINKTKGNSYFMESILNHEIKEITHGTRFSLVSFIVRKDLFEKSNNNLI